MCCVSWHHSRSGTALGIAAAFVACLSARTRAQHYSPYLAAKINTHLLTNDGSRPAPYPDTFAPVPGGLVFSATRENVGTELWFTDGTPAGTRLLKDIESPCGASSQPQQLMALGTVTLFAATTSQSGRELWRTDGTAAGTYQVLDLMPGIASSSPSGTGVFKGNAYFGTQSINGARFWKSDGTPEGTVPLAAAVPAAVLTSRSHCATATRLWFTASENHGTELWVTDGSPGGTFEVADLAAGTASSLPEELVDLGNGAVIFTATTAATGRELWRSDGSIAGTFLLKDFAPGDASSFPTTYDVVINNIAYFTVRTAQYGEELWRTDGTAAGTFLVSDIAPGTTGSTPSQLTAWHGTLYFKANDNTRGESLWVSDGTSAGTRLAVDFNTSAPSDLEILGSSSGGLYAFADNQDLSKIYRTNGTPEGTVELFAFSDDQYNLTWSRVFENVLYARLKNLQTDTIAIVRSNGDAGGTSVLTTQDNSSRPLAGISGAGLVLSQDDGMHGEEPCIIPTTGNSSVLLADVNDGPGTSNITSLRALGDAVLFAADDDEHGIEPWAYSRATGAVLLGDFTPGIEDSTVGGFLPAEGNAFMVLQTRLSGAEPWITDATPAGTHQVTDLSPTAGDSSIRVLFPDGPLATVASGRLLFSFASSKDPAMSNELISCDGTAGGTFPIIIDPALNKGPFVKFSAAVMNNTAYVVADDGTHGYELWRSNGTVAGTAMVMDIHASGAGLAGTTPITCVQNSLFFSANDGVHGFELWTSDGTPQGTHLVRDIRAGTATTPVTALGSLGNRLLFWGDDGVHGRELWISDGTEPGTFMIVDLAPGSASSTFVSNAANVGLISVFTLADALGVWHLWATDGTASGTRLIADVRPTFRGFFVAGNRVFFAGTDSEHGTELWSSDGTPEGTSIVADLNPGACSALRDKYLAFAGSTLYFGATTPGDGHQLWAVKVCFADFDDSGFVDTDDYSAFVLAFEAGTDDADFDGSGFVDTDDFTAFVLAFEAGC